MGSNPNPVYDTQYNEWGELTSLRQGSAVQSSLLTTQFAYDVRGVNYGMETGHPQSW